ncbi:MAG: YceI family protein [Bacteroidota bacterium]
MVTGFLNIEPGDSYVTFKVKKLGILTVRGIVSGFDGQIYLDLQNMGNSFFNVCLTPVTIQTGISKRDEHLRSMEFFYVKKYPIICFKSSSVEKMNNLLRLKGTLQMLGTDIEVVIPMEYKDNIFKGAFSFNRKKYGLGKKYPGILVGNTIDIKINCITTKK